MRVCDRCKVPEKRSSKTYRDQHGGEIELCEGCQNDFIAFLDKRIEENKSAGKTAKK